MNDDQEFIDYYALLQVSPDCNEKVLDIAYHHFAKLYHPDRIETADVAKFNEITECYRLLKDPEKRSEYDRLYEKRRKDPIPHFDFNSGIPTGGNTALDDAKIHEKILILLYKKRRENAHSAGIVAWLLEEILDCPEQQFEFHIWYLKSKGFLELTSEGTLAITIQGVDHVISSSLSGEVQKLLLSKDEPHEEESN